MDRRLKTIIRSQKGFTLIEMLAVIAVTGLISSSVAGTIYQVFTVSARSTATMTAVKDVESAVHWLSRDIQMAQTVKTDDPASILTLTWVEWNTGESVTVTYTIDNGVLWRNHSGSGHTVVARDITVMVEPKPYQGGKLTLTVTAILNGLRPASETRVVEVIPRPGL